MLFARAVAFFTGNAENVIVGAILIHRAVDPLEKRGVTIKTTLFNGTGVVRTAIRKTRAIHPAVTVLVVK